ncbi:MAG TPA: anthranilate phosphoribosyltransferase [Planctomycetota bacterium]|nr:anthranilate phosphoribosyltransferase [Planctomycetota bacterium]
MNLADALSSTVAGRPLTRLEAHGVFAAALGPEHDPAQLAGFLTALAVRGESADVIAGAVDALRAAMLPFEHDCPDAIDTCGTGGDGLGTFNLSTASAIVAAAAGAHVVKHGNRAASSRCGSADLLEAAGLRLDLTPRGARDVLEEVGITFLFAPRYHPALRHAAAVRRALGVRTVFNLLGPLVNPGRPRRQLLGLGDGSKLDVVAEVLEALEVEHALVVHGAGGADELTLEGENRVRSVGARAGPAPRLDARALGLAPAPVSALAGGDAAANLSLLRALLSGERGPLADALRLNTCAALLVAGLESDPHAALQRAGDALDSGAAADLFERWIDCSARAEASA